jgi:hypothetical protein
MATIAAIAMTTAIATAAPPRGLELGSTGSFVITVASIMNRIEVLHAGERQNSDEQAHDKADPAQKGDPIDLPPIA